MPQQHRAERFVSIYMFPTPADAKGAANSLQEAITTWQQSGKEYDRTFSKVAVGLSMSARLVAVTFPEGNEYTATTKVDSHFHQRNIPFTKVDLVD